MPALPRTGLVLAFLGLGSFLGLSLSPETLCAQEENVDSRVMAATEKEALKNWALARLEDLERSTPGSGSPSPGSQDVERLWALYFLSVEEREWEGPAVALADSLMGMDLPEARQIRGLGAAMEVVRAKNSRWPPNKLKHLRKGLSALNGLVEESPDDPALRYLRLMSCYYLPFFLDQDHLVEEDLKALGWLLPDRPDAFSPHVYQGVLRFVLGNGEFEESIRSRLSASLDVSVEKFGVGG